MKLKDHLGYIVILLCIFFPKNSYGQTAGKDYLYYVKQFADTLLAVSPDTYGQVQTGLWASVIDTRDLSILTPNENVSPTRGTRKIDRAVWGSNFYHDVDTIHLFHVLSKVTDDSSYQKAVDNYANNFLKYTQNPYTGLLGWGEHLYYNFYSDTVMVGDGHTGHAMSQEFLAETPPWKLLWSVDSTKTKKALEAQVYHFRSPHTQTFMFNRHANWNKIKQKEYRGLQQYQEAGQAWIKHSALLAYSFMYLYKKTNNKKWLKWSKGVGSLYWRYRNPETNLTPSDLDDPRLGAHTANINSMSLLAYWLLKTWQLNQKEEAFKKRAVMMLKAIADYSWDPKRKLYRGSFKPDGTMVDSTALKVYITGYSTGSILRFGRIAAYFANVLHDSDFELIARRCTKMLTDATLPKDFVINSLAITLNYTLDMYDLTGNSMFLRKAQEFADTGIQKLYNNGLFVREPGDPYYEAKLGTGSFVQGLLRLYLDLHPQMATESDFNWSF